MPFRPKIWSGENRYSVVPEGRRIPNTKMSDLEIKVTRHHPTQFRSHCYGVAKDCHCSGKDVACISVSAKGGSASGGKGIGDSLSRELEPTIKDLRAENIVHYIFDFSEVTTINSTGIGFMIKLVGEVQGRHGGVVVIGASERLKTACDLVGLWGYVALADNLEDALKLVSEFGKIMVPHINYVRDGENQGVSYALRGFGIPGTARRVC